MTLLFRHTAFKHEEKRTKKNVVIAPHVYGLDWVPEASVTLKGLAGRLGARMHTVPPSAHQPFAAENPLKRNTSGRGEFEVLILLSMLYM
jgi:hypothetical protein